MRKNTVWFYQGTFTLTFLRLEDARFVPNDYVWRKGKVVRVVDGKIRYSNVGFEFRTRNGIPFYFAPRLIARLQNRWRTITWIRQERGHRRVCGRCGGAGNLFRPTKKKYISYIRCSSCGGPGLTGTPKGEIHA